MKSRFIIYGFLGIIVLLAFYFHNNAGSIYETMGNNYNKSGNTQKALVCYEKSIKLGNKSTKLKDNYVNLLISSSLSIDAQEKLAQVAEDKTQDSASLNAQYYLYNLKREVHNKYPQNYIKQAPYNKKIVHWGTLPIT